MFADRGSVLSYQAYFPGLNYGEVGSEAVTSVSCNSLTDLQNAEIQDHLTYNQHDFIINYLLM